eukprot:CAMPEP_0201280980 /NCGR_PEP_ID=MMETSP1317-20130820/356_1 /ASSEMBLY_ACC=CAM_ASM_000770 /TAXON_ID=187299 /ORGANISM="Undescribed Undescribed, Strain Undescribed" /LENGTH=50 /DNA_ID=CAMNT_0047589553 /DNA_START=1399 /DNA_END=1551 /DNA_ORIENTATION=-
MIMGFVRCAMTIATLMKSGITIAMKNVILRIVSMMEEIVTVHRAAIMICL